VLEAGQTVEVFGFELDAQSTPSKYLSTLSQAGVYPQSRFAQDELRVVRTGPNQNSTTISILAKNS
jgi:hypothetical protein